MSPDQSAIDGSVREFLDGLASKAATPGGGSVAALSGALAAGLVSMVCQFTVGREKYAEVEDDMQRVLARSEALRAELQRAVDEDIAAYGGYREATALPQDTDEQRAARDSALAASSRRSTEVPLEVAEWSAELLELALESAQKGNPNLISDSAVAAQLAAGAHVSAYVNVRLNERWIDDPQFRAEIESRLVAAEERARLHDSVSETMNVVFDRTPG